MTEWILVDYENVQPDDFDSIRDSGTNIMVFLGPKQKNIPAALATALQPFGTAARYIQCSRQAKNALDFHITFYLGRLSLEHPKARFVIVSRDTGYDPLVRHAADTLGIDIVRQGSYRAEPPARTRQPKREKPKSDPPQTSKPRTPAAKSHPPSLKAVRDALVQAGSSRRPRKRLTLRNWINARFNKELTEAGFKNLIDGLGRRGLVTVSGDRVTYTLPPKPVSDG